MSRSRTFSGIASYAAASTFATEPSARAESVARSATKFRRTSAAASSDPAAAKPPDSIRSVGVPQRVIESPNARAVYSMS